MKVYSADTGLMISQTLGDRPFTEGALYEEVYSGDLGINEGMVIENSVAQKDGIIRLPLYMASCL